MTRQQRIAALRRALSKDLPGLTEVRHVTAFKAYRGGDKVTVEIEDSGYDCHPRQFRCYVTTEDGRVATGNPAETPEMAISTTHWNKLDKG